MKKLLCLLIVVFCLLSSSALADIYPNGGMIVDLVPEEDMVIFEDGTGTVWIFFGIEDWDIGDLVACVFWDAGTPEIFDDEILDVRYIGYVEQFE